MAELVRDYYESLQHEGLNTTTGRQPAIEKILDTIQTQLSPDNKQELETNLSKDNINEVLNLLSNGKAPGMDGLPYEFWKWVNEKSKSLSEKDQEDEPFNLIECLTAVFNDVEVYEIVPNMCFAD
ncbi:uncharacterized protein F5147DRAFT_555390, partial [Suillus discolor]